MVLKNNSDLKLNKNIFLKHPALYCSSVFETN
jgi:hypothetical protein